MNLEEAEVQDKTDGHPSPSPSEGCEAWKKLFLFQALTKMSAIEVPLLPEVLGFCSLCSEESRPINNINDNVYCNKAAPTREQRNTKTYTTCVTDFTRHHT